MLGKDKFGADAEWPPGIFENPRCSFLFLSKGKELAKPQSLKLVDEPRGVWIPPDDPRGLAAAAVPALLEALLPIQVLCGLLSPALLLGTVGSEAAARPLLRARAPRRRSVRPT
jgi:hypothetical protein